MGNPVAWFEIVGKDGVKLRTSYRDLFEWPIDSSGSGMDYGLVAAQPAKAEKLGGTTVVPPTEIPGYGLTFARAS